MQKRLRSRQSLCRTSDFENLRNRVDHAEWHERTAKALSSPPGELLMSRTWRAVRSVAVLVFAAWLSVEALAGAHLYTIQGDLCEGLRSRVENQQPLPKFPTLSTCVQRHNVVYRAFLLEF